MPTLPSKPEMTSTGFDRLKPKHGVTSLEQLVRETKKREGAQAKQAAAKDRVRRGTRRALQLQLRKLCCLRRRIDVALSK